MIPSLIPWRISRIRILARYLPSSAVARANSDASSSNLRARELRPSISPTSRELRGDLADGQRRLGLERSKLEQHPDRIAEILGRGENFLALVLRAGHRGDDLPDRASAHL